MGTVLEHPLNIFNTLLNNYGEVNKRFSNSYTRTNYDRKLGIPTGLKLFLEPMDRDSVRKMMLKQEEIFKQQVRELHRLYQAQKQLMAEIRSDEGTSSSFCHDNRHQSTSQLSSEDSRPNQYESWENMCFEGPFRKPKNYLERPSMETTIKNIAHDQASSLWRHLRQRTAMEGPEIDTDIELKLSIGCGAEKKKAKHGLHLDSEIGCCVSDPTETKQLSGQDRREELGSDFPVSSKEESLQGPPRNFPGLNLDIEEKMNSSTWMRR